MFVVVVIVIVVIIIIIPTTFQGLVLSPGRNKDTL
jgi:hypothetical protein